MADARTANDEKTPILALVSTNDFTNICFPPNYYTCFVGSVSVNCLSLYLKIVESSGRGWSTLISFSVPLFSVF